MHQQQYEYLVVELSIAYDPYKVAIKCALDTHSKEGWRMKEFVTPKGGSSAPLIIFERECLPYKDYNKTIHNFLENGNNI